MLCMRSAPTLEGSPPRMRQSATAAMDALHRRVNEFDWYHREMNAIPLHPHAFHGDWNYTIRPLLSKTPRRDS